jgi:N5-(cytidine 5'-diphosphoramidyl)-L-glutamine hydrolase
MIPIAVTQRVATTPTGERRDCLDQRWANWMRRCGLLPIPVPNDADIAIALCSFAKVAGLLLTGGNDLTLLGGDAPERDATENRLLELAATQGLPVLGVCRGMQVIQSQFGVPLHPVEGHVTSIMDVRLADGSIRRVNSYHRFGTTRTAPDLEVWARAEDGAVKAIRHATRPILGVMWHPERMQPFPEADIAMFHNCYSGTACAR